MAEEELVDIQGHFISGDKPLLVRVDGKIIAIAHEDFIGQPTVTEVLGPGDQGKLTQYMGQDQSGTLRNAKEPPPPPDIARVKATVFVGAPAAKTAVTSRTMEMSTDLPAESLGELVTEALQAAWGMGHDPVVTNMKLELEFK